MKYLHKITALMLAILLLAGLCGCGKDSGRYRQAGVVGEADFRVAFREGDPLRDIVSGALDCLAAQGNIKNLSLTWFGEDRVALKGNAAAMNELWDIVTERELIVGIPEENLPMAAMVSGAATGFDADLARAVCGFLGWTVRFQAIPAENVRIELASGNIDCAWGGFCFAEGASGMSLSPAYIKNSAVVLTLPGTGVSRLSRLKDKTLCAAAAEYSAGVLAAQEGLEEKLALLNMSAGPAACLQALDAGECDAILISEVSAAYYNK